MNAAMMEKIREVVSQEELNKLSVRYRFGQIKSAFWRVVGQFRRELSQNEVHSYAYLLQHKEFEATEFEVRGKVKDLRAHGYYSDPLMLFDNFSANVDAVRDTMLHSSMRGLRRVGAGDTRHRACAPLCKDFPHLLHGLHQAHTSVVGVWSHAGGSIPTPHEGTERLSPTMSFEAVYKVLLLGDGRQVLPANTRYVLRYRNGYSLAEILEKEFQPDPQFRSFAEAEEFEENARSAVGTSGGRQYLAT